MGHLKAGYGEKKITPPLGTDLAGFGFYLDRRSTRVGDDLRARALYLQNEKNDLLLLSLDLLSLGVEQADKIRKMIAKKLGISFQNILLACTHTHSGPAVQALPGLGEINRDYVRSLPPSILEAATRAVRSLEPASFGHHIEAIEPIGYHRSHGNFQEIDPWLRVGIFKLKKKQIFLLNYACLPVTLGPTKEISSDWPGATVKALEWFGFGGLVFQGFCGDIEPVSCLNRRLGNTRADYNLCGSIVAGRALKSLKYVNFARQVDLSAVEERIKLPLSIFPKKDLERETEAALEAIKQFPKAKRVVNIWRKKIEKNHDRYLSHPWMDNVPIQAMRIGKLKIIAWPGEPFCGLGLKLREKWPDLMTIGYANGDVGYLPPAEAYKIPGDYACYCAPKCYGTFNFSPEIESVLQETSHRLLSSI